MTVKEIIEAIQAKTGRVFVRMTMAGIAVGVPSSVAGVLHFGLVPIDDESRPRFVDFMVSLHETEPKEMRRCGEWSCFAGARGRGRKEGGA